ncbi:MAG: hypothetical protein WCJ30_28140, partial [Deltaproteobacteria bacterium]
TLTVTSLADSGPGSLRDTLAAAVSGDTIDFSPAILPGIIDLTSGQLSIDASITIAGPGPERLTVRRSTAASSRSSRSATRTSTRGT